MLRGSGLGGSGGNLLNNARLFLGSGPGGSGCCVYHNYIHYCTVVQLQCDQ